MSYPKVGIVVCTRNRYTALAAAVKAINEQSCRDWVVVVVDDASEKPAVNKSVVDALEGNIHYHLRTKQGGISSSRNEGYRILMERYAPEFFCMLDDDDLWPPYRLELGLRAMADTSVGMSYGIQWMTDMNLKPIVKYTSKTTYWGAVWHAVRYGKFSFPAKTFMFKTDFLQEFEPRRNTLFTVDSREDVALAIRALRYATWHANWRVQFVDQLMAYWRQADPARLLSEQYLRRQRLAHAELVRQLVPSWLTPFALATAPLARRLPLRSRRLIRRAVSLQRDKDK